MSDFNDNYNQPRRRKSEIEELDEAELFLKDTQSSYDDSKMENMVLELENANATQQENEDEEIEEEIEEETDEEIVEELPEEIDTKHLLQNAPEPRQYNDNSYNTYNYNSSNTSQPANSSKASLICGILGLLCCGLPLSIAAIVLYFQEKKKNPNASKVGLILGIIQIVIFSLYLFINFLGILML